MHDTEKILDSLITRLSNLKEVESIGISGSKTPLPKAGEGDIDIFIYCDTIPKPEKRELILSQFGDQLQNVEVDILENGHWGVGDCMLINGVETWLMYFTTDETLQDIEAILHGEYPDKLNNYYYPIGRCAMFRNMTILFERYDFLVTLKQRLAVYPEKLSQILTKHHLEELKDTEDLERAVLRKDALFYHFALDLAIDNFLQALFAINRTYFPSRKRTLEYIKNFTVKPEKCGERLLEIVRLGGYAEGIEQSYELWRGLVEELRNLYTN